MSTHIIHRVEGDLAPPVNFELVGQNITGWTIQLQGTYRDTFQAIDIAHTVDVAADGKGHFDWGATDLIRGVADWEIFFTPTGGSPKSFTIPAENSLLLQVRGKKEPGPGVLSGGGDQITIDQDGRTLKIFGGDGGGGGVVLFTTQVSLLASTLDDGSIAYAEDTDTFFFRQAGVWQEQIDNGTIPGTIATILTDHDKAAHDALGIDAATVGGVSLPGTIFAVLTDHNVAAHNALGIDAATVGGIALPGTLAAVISDHDRAAHDALGIGNLVYEDEAQTLTAKILSGAVASNDLTFSDNAATALGAGADSRLYYDGTDTFFDLRAVGTGDLMMAFGAGFPSPDADNLHLWFTTAGLVSPIGSGIVLERGFGTYLSFLMSDTATSGLAWGSPTDGGFRAAIDYSGANDLFRFRVDQVDRLKLGVGSFAFQESTMISTTAGGLTLAPFGGTEIIAGASTAIASIIRGAASQSANLTEWQDSTTAVLLSVDDDGSVVLSGTTARIYDSTGPLNLGLSATTDHSLFSGGVLIGGPLEVDSTVFFDGSSFFFGAATFVQLADFTATKFKDDFGVSIGTGFDTQLFYSTANVPNTLVLGLGAQSRGLVVTEKADVGFNFAHPLQATPTVFIHSQNQSTTEWLSLAFGTIATGVGDLTLSPAGGVVTIAGASTEIASIIRGAASQSVNLTEWQDSASSVLGVVDPAGFIGVGNNNPDTPLHLTVSGATEMVTWERSGFRKWGVRVQDAGGTAFNIVDVTGGTIPLTINASGFMGLLTQSPGDRLDVRGAARVSGANSANAQFMKVESASTELTGLTGASVTATDLIPAGSLVLGVSCRVTTAITGATTFDVGDGTDVDRFGAAIAIALNTTSDLTDTTVATPPIYAGATGVVLTANVSDFTAGAVRITVHYITISAPTS